MASTFKDIKPSDRVSTRTLLHEAIPLTGTIVSGTYGTFPNGDNIKNFSHGMFQSVYDYPYLSSSANHFYDVTAGYSSNSALSGTHAVGGTLSTQKINIYNQMAQVLVGHDSTGSILEFDQSGSISDSGTKMRELFLGFGNEAISKLCSTWTQRLATRPGRIAGGISQRRVDREENIGVLEKDSGFSRGGSTVNRSTISF